MQITKRNDIILVANEASTSLAGRIATELRIMPRQMLKKHFRDGEIYHAFPEDIAGRDLVVVGATHTPR